MSDDKEIEAVIQAKGLTAPRVTTGQIEGTIVETQFYVFPGTTTTICCITLRNGHTVLGHSACASPENFDEEVGRDIAKRNAVNQIWALEGYLLSQRLYEGKATQPPSGEVGELPRWRSHKVVQAMRIDAMSTSEASQKVRLSGVDNAGREMFVVVDMAYATKHQPQVGGYYVRYADGYESFSPSAAFEEGYIRA